MPITKDQIIFISPINVEILNATHLVEAARHQFEEIKHASETAWKTYQLFCDDDPRFFDPNCNYEQVQAWHLQRDRLRINAELAEEAYFKAWSALDRAKSFLLSLLEDES